MKKEGITLARESTSFITTLQQQQQQRESNSSKSSSSYTEKELAASANKSSSSGRKVVRWGPPPTPLWGPSSALLLAEAAAAATAAAAAASAASASKAEMEPLPMKPEAQDSPPAEAARSPQDASAAAAAAAATSSQAVTSAAAITAPSQAITSTSAARETSGRSTEGADTSSPFKEGAFSGKGQLNASLRGPLKFSGNPLGGPLRVTRKACKRSEAGTSKRQKKESPFLSVSPCCESCSKLLLVSQQQQQQQQQIVEVKGKTRQQPLCEEDACDATAASAAAALDAATPPGAAAAAEKSEDEEAEAVKELAVAAAALRCCGYHLHLIQPTPFAAALSGWFSKHRRKLPWRCFLAGLAGEGSSSSTSSAQGALHFPCRGDPPPYTGWRDTRRDTLGPSSAAAAAAAKGKAKGQQQQQRPITSFFKPHSAAKRQPPEGTSNNSNNSSTSDGKEKVNGSSSKETKNGSSSCCCKEEVLVVSEEEEAEACSISVGPRSPYGVWVSEVMLQQTQVQTAIKYWLKWMTLWPSVSSLAKASLDQIYSAWSGLGYYRRQGLFTVAAAAVGAPAAAGVADAAVLLLEGAKYIMEKHGGEQLLLFEAFVQLPCSLEELQAIPGVGPYTSGAIGALAFGLRVPAVDGNVTRVFCRVLGDKTAVRRVSCCCLMACYCLPLSSAPALTNLSLSACLRVSAACFSLPPVATVFLTKGIGTPSDPRTQQQIIPTCLAAALFVLLLPLLLLQCVGGVSQQQRRKAELRERLTARAEGDFWFRYPLRVNRSKKKDYLVILSLFSLSQDSEGRLHVLLEQRGSEGLLARQWGPPTSTWGAPSSEGKVTTGTGSLSSSKTKEAKSFLIKLESLQQTATQTKSERELHVHLAAVPRSRVRQGRGVSTPELGSASHQFSHQSHTIHVFTTHLSWQPQQRQQQQQQQRPPQRRWATMEETKLLLVLLLLLLQ
ncbi:hypothetical protein Emag_003120 [Eimeria magna]